VTDDIVGHWPRKIGDITRPDLYLGLPSLVGDTPTSDLSPTGTAVPEEAQAGTHVILLIVLDCNVEPAENGALAISTRATP